MLPFPSEIAIPTVARTVGPQNTVDRVASWFTRLGARLGAWRRQGGNDGANRRPWPAGPLPRGAVAIVGAGPGSADLMTLRALNCLRQADVIVYDKLVGPEILDFASPSALKIYAGKTRGCHTKSQDEINALLLAHANRGKRVVRLKGGDPFIFGRGGEEAQFLAGHGIAVDIVPGVTAAAGCAAAAGIPLTHRGTAQAVTFLTGHAQHGEPDLPWADLVDRRQTLVVYMGVSTAATIARRLIAHGADPAMPVAVVENGTLPGQVIGRGRLDDLIGLMARNAITGPAVIVIGAVAALDDVRLPAPPQSFHAAPEDTLS